MLVIVQRPSHRRWKAGRPGGALQARFIRETADTLALIQCSDRRSPSGHDFRHMNGFSRLGTLLAHEPAKKTPGAPISLGIVAPWGVVPLETQETGDCPAHRKSVIQVGGRIVTPICRRFRLGTRKNVYRVPGC
jgi:hypothetical protein